MSLLLIVTSSRPVVNDSAARSLKKHLMLRADAASLLMEVVFVKSQRGQRQINGGDLILIFLYAENVLLYFIQQFEAFYVKLSSSDEIF